MSNDELHYCERYQEILNKCHHDSFLNHLPENLQSQTEDEMSKIKGCLTKCGSPAA